MGTPSPASTGPVPWVRRPLTVACAALALAVPTACAASFDAPTGQDYQPAVGVNDRSGQVYAINTLVVTDGAGHGTVVVALVNQADTADVLRAFSVSSDDDPTLQAVPLTDADVIPLPANDSVQVGTTGALRVRGEDMRAGRFIDISFEFANAEPVELKVPVVEDTEVYADVPLGPAETTTTSPAPPSTSQPQPTQPSQSQSTEPESTEAEPTEPEQTQPSQSSEAQPTAPTEPESTRTSGSAG